MSYLWFVKMSKPKTPTLNKLVESLIEQEIGLGEVPIDNYGTVGDFTKRSSISSPVDRALVTHPKAVEKIKRQWSKTPYNFDIFVVNDKRVNKVDFREIGAVPEEFVRKDMKLTPEELPINPSNITIIFTNNAAAEKTHLTGWTMAHRFGHALRATRGYSDSKNAWEYFVKELRDIGNEIMSELYRMDTKYKWAENEREFKAMKILQYLSYNIGTMKAARDKNVRSWYEFGYELLAQYMITGKVTLNKLPQSIVTGYGPYGRKKTAGAVSQEKLDYFNNELQYFQEQIEGLLLNVMDAAQGEIFVM